MVARSYLYVPGIAGDKLARVLDRGADAIIVDLEDAVPPAAKAQARATVAAWLDALPDRADAPQIWIRLNPGAAGHLDAHSVVGPRVGGVMLAKTETRAEVDALDDVLAGLEQRHAMPRGAIGVVPLLESAAALLEARAIAAGPRVVRLQVGEADLAADLGLASDADDAEWAPIRSQIVVVSAAAGIGAPVAPVSTDFSDLDGFAATTRALARRGYVGRACIHPAQIAVANEVFTPTPQTLAEARDLLDAFERAVGDGHGVTVGPDGRMIDEAVVRRARGVLALAR